MHHLVFELSLTSKCQLSPERRMLDLESDVMSWPGSIPTGGIFFTGFFLFSSSKLSDANISIIANFVKFVKTPKQ